MPVGFSSAARNLFLLGTTASGVTNFFRNIDGASDPDTRVRPSQVRYNYGNQNIYVSGTAELNNVDYGWFQKRDDDGTAVTVNYDNQIKSTTSVDLTLNDMKLVDPESATSELIICGKSGNSPYIALYDNVGVQLWASTSNSGGLEYFSVAVDNSGYYVTGKTNDVDSIAYVEKFDLNGSPTWGKSAFMVGRYIHLSTIAVNSRDQVMAAGKLEDDNGDKGYIVKLDANNGNVLWDKTLTTYDSPEYSSNNVSIENIYVDGNDNIYVVGNIETLRGFVIKMSPEGNIIWQKEAPYNVFYNKVIADTDTGQVSVFGLYRNHTNNDQGGHITKFSRNGDLVFRRILFTDYVSPKQFGSTEVDGPPTSTSGSLGDPGYSGLGFDSTPSFFYLIFSDGNPATSKRFTYGKLSGSGNGLGAFTYQDGSGTNIDYQIVNLGSFYLNVGDRIGRLSDGSVRQDTSDLVTYPFSPNKILFDDLATHVANKKRQMDSADSFEYSGSPSIRPADFQELNLLGDVYSGSGNWLDQSGKGNDAVVNGATHNAAGYWEFDGTNDYVALNLIHDHVTNPEWAYEIWFKTTSGHGTLFGQQNTTTPDAATGWVPALHLNSDGTLRAEPFWTTTGTASADVTSGTDYRDGNWHHVVVSRENNIQKMYIDGSLETTGSSHTPSGYSNDYYYFVGAGYINPTRTGAVDGKIYFGGDIGEFRFYKRPLTPAQVFQNYNATKSKYINEAPNIAPKISDKPIVYDNSLLLNYDFGNLATYDDRLSGTYGTPTTVKNLSSSSFPGIINGATFNPAGYFEFDGTNDYIQSSSVMAPGSADFSVIMWYKVTSTSGRGGLFERAASSPYSGWVLGQGGDLNWSASVRDVSDNNAAFQFTFPTVGEWTCDAFTWNVSTQTLTPYRNGANAGTAINSGTVGSLDGNTRYPMAIGARLDSPSPQYKPMECGEVQLYSRVLTASEVSQNFNATRAKYGV